MNKKHLVVLFAGLMLSACEQSNTASCASDTTQKAVSQMLLDEVEKKLTADKYDDGNFIFDKAKIRASLTQLQLSVESIRTTKEDPNSSKKFCSGILKIVVPSLMLADAEQTKDFQAKRHISDDVRELNIDNDANVFTKKDFQYNVQPTDDGKELYVAIDTPVAISLLYDVTASALLKPILEVKKAEQLRQAREVEQLKQDAEAARLDAERLQAEQEKQAAERLKQELINQQIAQATAAPPVSNTTDQTGTKKDIPKFKDYPADKMYSGKNHALVLNEFGKEFKTRLSNALKTNKPDFAGHYIVTSWGCGTSGCNTGAVIDAITGVAYPLPVALSSVYPLKKEFESEHYDGQELIYKANSRLMIFAGNLEGLEQGDGEDTIAFYEFKDGKFKLLKSMPYGRQAK